ncbi:MAG: tetratricopeptide repeat protein [Phycisphaerales bacterium]
MSIARTRHPRVLTLSVLGLVLAVGGCTGSGSYTREGATLAEEKMSIIKAGTEWQMAHQAYLAGDLDKALRKVDASLKLNENVVKSHVLRGRILLEQGQLGSSLESLLTANTIDPMDTDAHYYLGIIYERLNEPAKAVSHYEQACELDGYNPAYAVAAAEMMIDLDRIDDARVYLESDPMFEHDPGVRQALGHIAMIQDKPDRAVTMFEEASMLAPEDNVILEDLVRAQIATERFAEADRHLSRLLRAEENRDRRDLQHMRARCLVALDQPVQARGIYKDLLAAEDGDNDLEAWVGLGNIAYLIDDQRSLRQCASRVVSLAPERAEGYSLWALYHRAADNLPKAITAARAAIDADPLDPSLRAFYGVLLTDAGQSEQAIDAFTDAVTLAPNNPGYSMMLEQAEAGVFASVPATTE